MIVDFAKLRSRVALLRGMIDGEAAYTGPAWIALDMTRRCNYVCLSCLFHCVRGVALLKEARRRAGRTTPRINLQMPLTRNGFRNIKGRVELALASGCEETTFGFFRDYGGQFENLCLLPEDGEAMRNDLLAAREQFDAAGVEHNIDEYLDRAQHGADAWRSLPCYVGWYEAYVKVDGTVLPCCPCNMVMGALAERSFPEIWNGLAYSEFRRRSSDPRQLERMTGQCNCSNCCLWRDNRRVHRIWRCIAPLVRRKNRVAIQ